MNERPKNERFFAARAKRVRQGALTALLLALTGSGKLAASPVTTEELAECEGGNPFACAKRARRLKYGVGEKADEKLAEPLFERAVDLFTKGCNAGDVANCEALSNAHRFPDGLHPSPDAKLADSFYEKQARAMELGCRRGSTRLCASVSVRRDRPNWENYWEEFAKWLQADCDQGRWGSCYSAGRLLEGGWGHASDDWGPGFVRTYRDAKGRSAKALLERGLTLGKQACADGPYEDCAPFVTAYAGYGLGPSEAVTTLEQGCGHDAAEACLELAIRRASGHGTPKDTVSALDLFKRLCTSGNGSACGRAAVLDSRQSLALQEQACVLSGGLECVDLVNMRVAARQRSVAAAAEAAAAKKKAEDIAACEAVCLKQKKTAAVCKRVCAQ